MISISSGVTCRQSHETLQSWVSEFCQLKLSSLHPAVRQVPGREERGKVFWAGPNSTPPPVVLLASLHPPSHRPAAVSRSHRAAMWPYSSANSAVLWCGRVTSAFSCPIPLLLTISPAQLGLAPPGSARPSRAPQPSTPLSMSWYTRTRCPFVTSFLCR